VRQIPHEADRVGQDHLDAWRENDPARQRIERREKLIGGKGAGAGQCVEQRRFAGIGVADQRDGEHLAALARLAAGATLPLAAIEAFANLLDAPSEHPAVHLELRLTRSASHADTATLAFQVAPCPDQPRRLVLQACQLDLQLALMTAGALREDIEDNLGTVEDPDFPETLEIALLDRRDLVIEKHQPGTVLLEPRRDLGGLSLADVETYVRAVPMTDETAGDLQTGRNRQGFEFVERRFVAALPPDRDTDEERERRIRSGGWCVQLLSVCSCWKLTARAGTTVEMACL
jgi:hypothetical protein